jgi:hypothetical protein
MDYHEHMKEHYGRLAPENEENPAFRAEATQDLLGTAKNATRPTSRPKTVAKVHLAQKPHPRAWRTALSVSFCNYLRHYRAPLLRHLTKTPCSQCRTRCLAQTDYSALIHRSA